jgi:hypothetical protein
MYLAINTPSYPLPPHTLSTLSQGNPPHPLSYPALLTTLLVLVHLQYTLRVSILSVFRPRGVPGPTSKLSLRVPAQMGRRETGHKGGEL